MPVGASAPIGESMRMNPRSARQMALDGLSVKRKRKAPGFARKPHIFGNAGSDPALEPLEQSARRRARLKLDRELTHKPAGQRQLPRIAGFTGHGKEQVRRSGADNRSGSLGKLGEIELRFLHLGGGLARLLKHPDRCLHCGRGALDARGRARASGARARLRQWARALQARQPYMRPVRP
eukprot:jgi/Psemu1/43928/gm1.43928_g